MTRSGISLLILSVILCPVVGITQEVLFDSAGVYIRSCGFAGGKWSGYEILIQGITNIEDSVFVVKSFTCRFPSLDSLDLMTSYSVPTEPSQESTLQNVTIERKDSLSHFGFRSFFLIKNWTKNDVKISMDQIDVEIILYGNIYPIMDNHNSTECIGRKQTWSRIVSVPTEFGRRRSHKLYAPFGKR